MIALVSIVARFRTVEDLTRPPSGLLYVGDALKKAGHEVKIYHISANEIDETVKQIKSIKPLYVGFSVFTGYPCYISAVMSEKLKIAAPQIPIVWGGIHPSLDPENCLKESYIDYVVIGEGEKTIVELTQELKNKTAALEKVKGIGYKNNGKIVINERREFIANLDDFRMDWSLVDIKSYVRPSSDHEKSICFITSRGCPFNCGFCYNQGFHLRKFRAHSIDFVVNELVKIKQQTGISRVTFDDDNFFVNPKRGFEILYRLKDAGITCDWLEFSLDLITPENMNKLTELGVKMMFFGWESGCDRVLKLINKPFDKEFILKKCHILSNYPKVKYKASGIIGFPTQTWEEIKETIDFTLEISDILPNVAYNLGTYLPFPGTQLYELAQKEGFVPPKNQMGWKEFDMMEGKLDVTWLKWADKNTGKKLFLIDKFAQNIGKVDFNEKKSIFKIAGKYILYLISRFRMRYKIFGFPIEAILYKEWTKAGIKTYLKKFK